MKSKRTGNPVIIISAPVRKTGSIIGVVFGVLDINYFSSMLIDTIKIGQTGYTYIYDKNGLLIAHPDRQRILQVNMNDFDFGKKMLASEKGVMQYAWNNQEKIVAYKTEPTTGWTVAVSASINELLTPLRACLNINVITNAITISVLVMVIWLVLRSIDRQIGTADEERNSETGSVVMSDEVRNLAMQAADAAKKTSDLIEETVKRIDIGQ